MIEPNMYEIVKNTRLNKKICRRCYARLPLTSVNCRKCSGTDLRNKKTLRK